MYVCTLCMYVTCLKPYLILEGKLSKLRRLSRTISTTNMKLNIYTYIRIQVYVCMCSGAVLAVS